MPILPSYRGLPRPVKYLPKRRSGYCLQVQPRPGL